MITIIAAVQKKDNGIGKNNDVLFHIRPDFIRMKKMTMGHPVTMGRLTYESLPEKFRPLPGRTNIVITRKMDYQTPEGIIVTHSLSEATERASAIDPDNFILGGGEIYKEALKLGIVDRLELTIIDGNKEADTFFPDWNGFGKTTNRIQGYSEEEGVYYEFVTIEK
jgi:dihydrofolate reductase